MDFETKIKEKLEQLRKDLEDFVKNANQQIIAYNSAINTLENLLKENDEENNDNV